MIGKGLQTREMIKQNAYSLFAKKGLQAVTMKDICEVCGLSRGGLYRHFGSPEEIFREIIGGLSGSSLGTIKEEVQKKLPAVEILDRELNRMLEEMLDKDRSLSIAIYEYSSLCSSDFMLDLNAGAKEKWRVLLEYGMDTGEFWKVQIEQMTDTILYVYQGIRLWSNIIPMGEETSRNIIRKIRKDLVKEDGAG